MDEIPLYLGFMDRVDTEAQPAQIMVIPLDIACIMQYRRLDHSRSLNGWIVLFMSVCVLIDSTFARG